MKKSIFFIIILLLTSCKESISEKIVYEIESKNKNVIALKEIADFPWDNLFVFSGIYSNDEISKIIGLKYYGDLSASDGITTLIFTDSMKIVHEESYRKFDNKILQFNAVNFNNDRIPHFTPDNAIFKVAKDTTSVGLSFILVPTE